MADFLRALPYVLENEGGLSNDKHDRGGLTNLGITQATLDHFNNLFPTLGFPASVATLGKANAQEIYRRLYWRFDTVEDQGVATKVFDLVVNFGSGGGVKVLQVALNRLGANIAVDGGWGPKTQAATNAADPAILMPLLCKAAEERYQAIVDADPTQMNFLKGWLNRARRIPDVV